MKKGYFSRNSVLKEGEDSYDFIERKNMKVEGNWRSISTRSNKTRFLFEELCPSSPLVVFSKGEKWEPPLSVPKTVRRAINFLR